MLEKIGHVRNPLTIIALFAGLAEISGTVVLPFLEPDVQTTYVWFLMLFPTVLVVLFYVTLNFNHRVLYAPSDYKDEKNFVRGLRLGTSQERFAKLTREVDEFLSDTPKPEAQHVEPTDDTDASPRVEVEGYATSRYLLAEELVLAKLGGELGPLDRGIQLGRESGYLFDAVAFDHRGITAIEVKYYPRLDGIQLRLPLIVEQMKTAWASMPEVARHQLKVILVLVSEKGPIHFDALWDYDPNVFDNAPFEIEVRTYILTELEAEMGWRGP